jgi:cell division GTPase FtsZ
MAEDRPRRVSIGFAGGQVLVARMAQEALDGLHAVVGNDGWHQLRAVDGEVKLDLGQVVYVQVDSDEHRVGF